jgi:Fe2+ or Zn2+ uptake regulation protein
MNDVEDVLAGVRGATDYDIVGHRIEIYGLCPACKALQAT